MTRLVAYLCAKNTISTAHVRRLDAFEHDRAFATLRRAFSKIGRHLVEVVWDDTEVDWRHFESALIGSTWDYSCRRDIYLNALKRISFDCRLFNSLELVTWNTSKFYLKDLEAKGISLIPTIWPDRLTRKNMRQLLKQSKSGFLLAKPIVGACSEGQILFDTSRMPCVTSLKTDNFMVQVFYPEISNIGEISLIFFGKNFSHAVKKMPAKGDYRVQTLYGGTEEIYDPDQSELLFAKNVLKEVKYESLYSRVDLFRVPDSGLNLMEVEMAEAYLYPDFALDDCAIMANLYIEKIR